MGESVAAGLMCCSPQRSGFEVSFHGLSIGKAISRDLHGA
jgi:regulation of enolase protein 1 (concanavalin A-like superfamily)